MEVALEALSADDNNPVVEEILLVLTALDPTVVVDKVDEEDKVAVGVVPYSSNIDTRSPCFMLPDPTTTEYLSPPKNPYPKDSVLPNPSDSDPTIAAPITPSRSSVPT